jgi:hypothetical protein
VISGMILFINSSFGQQSEVYLKGTVIDKYEYSSSRKAEYNLTLQNFEDGKIYKFDTFGTETQKYKINDRFEKKMYKGSLGLIYSKN